MRFQRLRRACFLYSTVRGWRWPGWPGPTGPGWVRAGSGLHQGLAAGAHSHLCDRLSRAELGSGKATRTAESGVRDPGAPCSAPSCGRRNSRVHGGLGRWYPGARHGSGPPRRGLRRSFANASSAGSRRPIQRDQSGPESAFRVLPGTPRCLPAIVHLGGSGLPQVGSQSSQFSDKHLLTRHAEARF